MEPIFLGDYIGATTGCIPPFRTKHQTERPEPQIPPLPPSELMYLKGHGT